MSSFPCLVRTVSGPGQIGIRWATGWRWRTVIWSSWQPGVSQIRCAVAFDLKTFCTVIGTDSVQVAAADVFDFFADQRGGRRVIRRADRESG